MIIYIVHLPYSDTGKDVSQIERWYASNGTAYDKRLAEKFSSLSEAQEIARRVDGWVQQFETK